MAKISKNLAIGTLTSTALTQLYLVPTGFNTTGHVLSFTNTTATNIVIDIYHNDGSSDILLKTLTLPGGSGVERIYEDFQLRTFNAGHALKIQASVASTFNFCVSGAEREL